MKYSSWMLSVIGGVFLSQAAGAVTIDHRHVAAVTGFPQVVMNAIGQQKWFFSHASVGGNMVNGLNDLRTSNTSFYRLATTSVTYDSGNLRAANPPATTLVGRVYECNRGNPGWQSKFSIFSNSVAAAGWNFSKVDFAMDKLCYVDQAADASVYLATLAHLEAQYTNTTFVYATMPLMTAEDANNRLRNGYNRQVREFCAAHDKLLFDIADMEAHTPDGVEQLFTYNGTNYQKLWSGFTSDGGHLNTTGRQWIAKGWYAVAATRSGITNVARTSPLIVDHTCADASQIPDYWIGVVKSNVNLHYAHTSHGSQLNSGLGVLANQDSRFGFASSWCELPNEPNALRMYDGQIGNDYISPDLYWEGDAAKELTRTVLNNNPALNISMWAWCGQVSYYDDAQILDYLDAMSEFERQYPHIIFIYMTGHLDGSGTNGTLHLHNNMIRDYCRANNKVLFDFADLESYDPDGNEFLSRGATDECNYDGGGNWATEWCAAHPGSLLCADCSCAHSQPVNCNRKERALWWLLARLCGWQGAPGSGEARISDGTLHVVWNDVCTGTVYKVAGADSPSSDGAWNEVARFTNQASQADWGLPLDPSGSPARCFRLESD